MTEHLRQLVTQLNVQGIPSGNSTTFGRIKAHSVRALSHNCSGAVATCAAIFAAVLLFFCNEEECQQEAVGVATAVCIGGVFVECPGHD
jgi:hypothetical protein